MDFYGVRRLQPIKLRGIIITIGRSGKIKTQNVWQRKLKPTGNRVLKKFIDWWWNFYFLNRIKNYQDFIGLNHYFHNRIKGLKFNQNKNEKISDLGWEIYPEGIYHVLKDLKKYNKPIYITENGLADAKDQNRKWFVKESLHNIHKAIADGVNVRGYFYWSLLDNFEWDKGFWPRFGLIEIDYNSLARKPRLSSWIYSEIAKNNSISGGGDDEF